MRCERFLYGAVDEGTLLYLNQIYKLNGFTLSTTGRARKLSAD
jgi:hypothetical protein